jgi:cyclopropane fatty-acyl-phospholipid synthase-like methyltransferase
VGGIRAVHEGVWLGLSSREVLHRITDRQYLTWKHYRAVDFNESDLLPWEKAAVDRYFSECRSILLGACGGGREILALARRGIQVDGFECSAALVESCRTLLASKGIEAKVLQSLPDQVPEGLGIYDGLIMGWGGYVHIPGREARIRFLKQFRRQVRAGGPMLLSFFPRSDSRQIRWTFVIARFVRRASGSRETVDFGDTLPGVFQHLFTKEEIESELRDSGFKIEYYSEEPCGQVVGRATG